MKKKYLSKTYFAKYIYHFLTFLKKKPNKNLQNCDLWKTENFSMLGRGLEENTLFSLSRETARKRSSVQQSYIQ